MEVDDGSHTSFVLMDKGQIFMGRTETIVGDQEYYSIPWSGIGINLKPDHPYALPILSVRIRLDDSSLKYMGKYRDHHYFGARRKATNGDHMVFRVQT